MFWSRKKEGKEPQTPVETELPTVSSDICLAKYPKMDLRRAILDWRDLHIENVEMEFSRELPALFSILDHQLEEMSFKDLFKQSDFGKQQIEPVYLEWVNRHVTQLVKNAQKDLSRIFTHSLEHSEQGGSIEHAENRENFTDAAIAFSATGIGLVAGPTFAALSIGSAGGLLGFLGLTTIAWPVVAVGVVTVGGLLALGGYKSATLKSEAVDRYRKSMRKTIQKQVLGYDNEEGSIRENLQTYLDESAAKILTEIDQC